MLKITEYIHFISEFLSEQTDEVEKFNSFSRLDFTIDVHILLKNGVNLDSNYFTNKFDKYESINGNGSRHKDFNIRFITHLFSELEDEYVSCLFQNSDEFSIRRFRLNSYINKSNKDYKLSKQVPIVTFYSYKGGMGRTTTMVSYAIDLAVNKNKKVFIIDCDLEAPGYLNFFNLSNHDGLNSGTVNGLVEFLCDCNFSKNTDTIDLGDYCINVALGNDISEAELSNIYLMPAGNLNENLSQEYVLTIHQNRKHYLDGLSRLDLSDEHSLIAGFQTLLNKVQNTISPDIILIDSRTGFNDIIGTATTYFADMVVGFFGYNNQTVPGLLSLIDRYYDIDSNFKLTIVSSILPQTGAEMLVDNEKKLILQYITDRFDVQKDIPSFAELHRSKELEKVGTSESPTKDYISWIKNNAIEDYQDIFKCINKVLPEEIKDKSGINNSEIVIPTSSSNPNSNKRTIELRNLILRNLKETLSSISSFAETTDINENIFFFRECMNDFFDEEKFIIRGYKGTGKTFLYRALADTSQKDIADIIIERANIARVGKEEITYTPKFIDILSIEKGQNKSFDFVGLNYNKIEEPEYFFNSFWQIHTWNSILLDPEFVEIRKDSKLSEYVKDIKGNEAIKRFTTLIDSGIDTLIEIENDFEKINQYLKSKNKKLFLLYDQLDTRINPRYWDKAVSPLINYWREKWNSYSNILPKIFVRTDLYNNNLRGTNTARLADNIISIEWTIEEIFAYFFKLVFSNKKSAEAFWELTSRIGVSKTWVEEVKHQFEDNYNQFEYLERAHIDRAVSIFFGHEVIVSSSNLGKPWDYFRTNLSNADNNSISIRPFINTLDNNAIAIALAKVIKYGYVKEIIHSEIYASREVRIKAANTYFDDLTMDTSLQDLICFKDFINSDKGIDYRFKTLDESNFNILIYSVYESRRTEFKEISSEEDLKSLLYACGIMHEYITRGGKLYRFAPMYDYAWGLKSSVFDDKLWVNKSSSNNKSERRNSIIKGIVEFDGEYYHCKKKYILPKKRIEQMEALGKTITFKSRDVIKHDVSGCRYKLQITKFRVEQ